MDLVLGIDLGTSYFKLGLFDRKGQLQGLGRVAVKKQIEGGHCELPVAWFWENLNQAFSDALDEAHAQPSQVKAVAYSSQANSFVLLDSDGAAITPLILWVDQRAASMFQLKDANNREIDNANRDNASQVLSSLWETPDFMQVTGLGMSGTNFAAAKWRWFQKEHPAIWQQTAKALTISDYLVYGLTGQTLGDQGTASLLGLWDLKQGRWWDKALQAAQVTSAQLATPLLPGTIAGPSIKPKPTAGLRDLPVGIPVVIGSLDHHIAAIGAGVGTIAPACVSIGTVLACLRYCDHYQPREACCMGPSIEANQKPSFYQLAFSTNGASVLEWYQQFHAPQYTVPQLVELAKAVPADCLGLVAKPNANQYENLEGFLDLLPEHQHGHFVRAILQSVTESFASCVTQLFAGNRPARMLAVGGGAQSDFWMQMFADHLAMPIVVPVQTDTACLGAALFASVAASWHPDMTQAAKAWCQVDKIVVPR